MPGRLEALIREGGKWPDSPARHDWFNIADKPFSILRLLKLLI